MLPFLIYAGEWHGGIYHSPDNGETWNVINEMLSTRSVAMLRMSSEGEYLYAATQGEGVFRYQLKEVGTSNDEVTLEVPTELNLNQNYPNPFNPNTTITYSIARSGFVTLSILTTNGQKVMTLVEKREAAGNHTVVFDATSLPSGVYMYRLQANGAEVTKKLTWVK